MMVLVMMGKRLWVLRVLIVRSGLIRHCSCLIVVGHCFFKAPSSDGPLQSDPPYI